MRFYRRCATWACGTIFPTGTGPLCRGCKAAGLKSPKRASYHTGAPPAAVDPGREYRLQVYAERAAAELPLFAGRGG